MKNPVVVNGVTYNSWFKHRHHGQRKFGYNEINEFICNSIIDAYEFNVDIAIAMKLPIQKENYRFSNPENLPIGVTICSLEDSNRNVVSIGYAFCSQLDQFNKKTGRNKSLGKAVQRLLRKKEIVND